MAKKPISFWHRLLDLISPQLCFVCGKRLSAVENVICLSCNLKLPRTDFSKNPYENEMAKLFWGQIPIERAAAFFYYESHSNTTNIIYKLKYKSHPEIGPVMGRKVAVEFQRDNFFDGIDGIVPVPLTRERFRRRGYNQSEEIAKGVSEITGLPIFDNIVKRTIFKSSQTNKSRLGRRENVEHVFELSGELPDNVKHLLVVDDVVTTGSTVIACARQLARIDGIRISVLSLGLTKR